MLYAKYKKAVTKNTLVVDINIAGLALVVGSETNLQCPLSRHFPVVARDPSEASPVRYG